MFLATLRGACRKTERQCARNALWHKLNRLWQAGSYMGTTWETPGSACPPPPGTLLLALLIGAQKKAQPQGDLRCTYETTN